MKLSRYLIGTTVVASSLALAPVAMGQQGTSSGQPGTTRGPASGTPVEPSTAVKNRIHPLRHLREPRRALRQQERLASPLARVHREVSHPAQVARLQVPKVHKVA
jgi:hypothetical protein